MPDERFDASEQPVDLPLEDLRRAWARLDAPQSAPELEVCDERTRAAVAWMQKAWGRVEAPAPVVPHTAFRRASPRWMLPLAAAAGALLALGVWIALQRSTSGVRPEGVSQPSAERTTQPQESAPGGASGLIEGEVELAALAADRIELRSGPVRLILLTATASPHHP